MNCPDPIDHESYREIEKETLRGAYAKAIKNNAGLRRRIKKGEVQP